MAFSSALGGAFLFGEGVHGWYDAETGRYMDGLWFYDVNTHRWVGLHPGTDTRNPPRLTVTRDGFEGISEDRPVPIATMVHGYQMTAWDPRRQIFFAMPNHHSYFAKALPSVARFRADNRNRLNERRASPWMFDPWNLRWHRLKTPGPSPRTGYGNVLEYLPNADRLFQFDARRVAYYLPDKNTWVYPSVTGPRPPFGIDPTACHDPVRDRIYIGGGNYPIAPGPNALWVFDVKKNRWIDPAPAGSPGSNRFSTNIAVMTCEPRSGRVVLFRHAGGPRGVYVYDAGGAAEDVRAKIGGQRILSSRSGRAFSARRQGQPSQRAYPGLQTGLTRDVVCGSAEHDTAVMDVSIRTRPALETWSANRFPAWKMTNCFAARRRFSTIFVFPANGMPCLCARMSPVPRSGKSIPPTPGHRRAWTPC